MVPCVHVQTCVSHLLDLTSPALDTVKMQVHFDMNYSSRCKSTLIIHNPFIIVYPYKIYQITMPVFTVYLTYPVEHSQPA